MPASACAPGEALTAPAFKTLPRWEVAVEDNLVRVRNPVPFRRPRLPDEQIQMGGFVIIGGGVRWHIDIATWRRSGCAGGIHDHLRSGIGTRSSTARHPPEGYLGAAIEDGLPLTVLVSAGRSSSTDAADEVVAGINRTARRVNFDDGSALSYSKLLPPAPRRSARISPAPSCHM